MPKVGDVFNPYRMFAGNFVPDAISKYRSLPPGAKLVYARLCRYKGDHGDAYPSAPTLADEVGLSERQIWHYVNHLIDQKFISVTKREGQSSVYNFLWHPCFEGDTGEGRKKVAQTSLVEPVRLTAPPPTSAVNCTTTSAVNCTTPVRLTAPKENHLNESPEENQTPPTPSSICSAEDKADEISRMRARARGGHRLKEDEKEVLIRWLREHEPDHPAEAFASFLEDDYWREKKPAYPITGFIRQFDRYSAPVPQNGNGHAPIGQAAIEAGGGAATHAEAEPAAPELPLPCQEWNRVVTAGEPVDEWTKRDAPLWAALVDPDFITALPDVLALCQKIHQAQGDEASWLTFRWLLRVKNGQDNWYKLKTEGQSWVKKKKAPASRKSAGATALEEYLNRGAEQ